MDTRPVPPVALLDEPLSNLVKAHPHLVGLFIQNRVACGMCCFASFCSLRDALEIYEPSSGFLVEIYEQICPGKWGGSPN
jgi:hypothetical protein